VVIPTGTYEPVVAPRCSRAHNGVPPVRHADPTQRREALTPPHSEPRGTAASDRRTVHSSLAWDPARLPSYPLLCTMASYPADAEPTQHNAPHATVSDAA
jgi:hypothetical protein